MKKIIDFLKDEEGATMPEYALMVALVAIATIGVVKYLQSGIDATFSEAAEEMGGTPPVD